MNGAFKLILDKDDLSKVTIYIADNTGNSVNVDLNILDAVKFHNALGQTISFITSTASTVKPN